MDWTVGGKRREPRQDIVLKNLTWRPSSETGAAVDIGAATLRGGTFRVRADRERISNGETAGSGRRTGVVALVLWTSSNGGWWAAAAGGARASPGESPGESREQDIPRQPRLDSNIVDVDVFSKYLFNDYEV
jgi:hypothetical protein